MKQFPKLMIAGMIAAACAQSAQAVNMLQIDGVHASFLYDADFWGVGTASVVGDKIVFTTPSYFNQHAEGYGKSGEDEDRYTNESTSAVVVVAKAGYKLTGAVSYDLTTTYHQPGAGAYASYSNFTDINAGIWNGSSFDASSNLDRISLMKSRSSQYPGIGSGSEHTTGITFGDGAYAALGLDSYLHLSATQKGAGVAEAGLSSASYQFGVSAVPEPATYGMLLAGGVLIGLVGRRRRRMLGGSLLAAASLVGTAQAANYVEIAGDHVSFFYDVDYWGVDAAIVVGDKITLDTPSYVDRTAVGHTPSETDGRIFLDSDQAAVVAVARSGYLMTGVVGFKPTITYSIAAAGSKIELGQGDNVGYGSFNGSEFTFGNHVGWHSYNNKLASTGAATSGVSNFATENGFLYGAPSRYDTLAIDHSLYLSAIQNGVGTTKAAVTYSYDFATIAVVPEPTTYGMLLAGLGAMVLVARRKERKGQA